MEPYPLSAKSAARDSALGIFRMGLKGYLEDLGISEILQIVSLSKKSGTLALQSKQGQGTIAFLNGQIISAVSEQSSGSVGQALCHSGMLSQEQLEAALAHQRTLKKHQPLGEIIVELFQLDQDQIEAALQDQIEKTIFAFFSWQEGTFDFQLEEQQDSGRSLNPIDFILEKGVCPQWLVVKDKHLEAAGTVDENLLQKQVKDLERRTADKDICLLKGMLAELENPFAGGGIILLILRYASEIMQRAIMFDVRGRRLVGLGQFGLTGFANNTDEVVRKIRLTAEPESLFGQVLQQQKAIFGHLGSTQAERTLLEILGSSAQQAFLAPLVSEGQVIAILYGDNGPQGGPIEYAHSLEVFLSQAGIAMEQALIPAADGSKKEQF